MSSQVVFGLINADDISHGVCTFTKPFGMSSDLSDYFKQGSMMLTVVYVATATKTLILSESETGGD